MSFLRTLPRAASSTKSLWQAETKKVVFSGIQPTGVPHLGNYFGALRHWANLQHEPNSTAIFSIVDMHAITVKQDPQSMKRRRKKMLASLLAVGLDPKKCIIFVQSSVKQHAELMWILSCSASMGYLGRMTQWKSKLSLPANASPLAPAANKHALKLGLFSYPVLQAADILLYNTTHVPVGEDQAQHLEFTREIAASFNAHASKDASQPIFTLPETEFSEAKRIMSITDPSKKMSKSTPNKKSRILITDTKEEIHNKVRTALTDSIPGPLTYDRKLRPGVSNLLELLHCCDPSGTASVEEHAARFQDISMQGLKSTVVHAIDVEIREVRAKYEELMNGDEKVLIDIEEDGARRAEAIAETTMKRVRDAVGMGW